MWKINFKRKIKVRKLKYTVHDREKKIVIEA